jgi:hypothetical protein
MRKLKEKFFCIRKFNNVYCRTAMMYGFMDVEGLLRCDGKVCDPKNRGWLLN